MDLEDYYALLGLEKENVFCSEKDIKEMWKKISHMCHPDKSPPATRDFAEQRYKAQQKAYATLSVNQTRRGYDSTLKFDEKVPKEAQGKGADFFKVYGPVFERNARFSEIRPVPLLGNEKTPYDDVDRYVYVYVMCYVCCIYVCVYVYVYACVYVRMCMYCVCLCMYVV